MDTWRLIDSGPGPGAVNMALDRALFEDVKAGGRPALRFYGWSPACLSLGRNQRARGRVRVERARRHGIDVVRRPTGGMAVHHDRELTYAVAAPVGGLGSPREAYRAVNRALVAGLRALGVPAGIAGDAPAGRRRAAAPEREAGPADDDRVRGRGRRSVAETVPDEQGPAAQAPGRDAVCFRTPAPGEVVVGGRKLIGSAQRCERHTVLQHGSLLLSGGQRRVAELLDTPAPADGSVTLAALLDALPDRAALVGALAAGFEAEIGIRLARVEQVENDGRVRALERRFRSADWTWRR